MLYNPLSHLSGLYAAAIESTKGQPLNEDLTTLGESALRCLSHAHSWEESHPESKQQPDLLGLSDRYVRRIERVHKDLSVWVDDRQFVSLLCGFEKRWAKLVNQCHQDEDPTCQALIHESNERLKVLEDLSKRIQEYDEKLRQRYAEPQPI